MPYLGNEPAVAYTSTTKDTFSGDASTTDFTMSKSANVNAVRVVVENVIQDPTVAYTCSGTTLSFTSAPPTGTNNIYVVHLGPPAATIAPPTTINNATTFTGGVTLKNETAEDTDGGRESIVTFQGTQSGNEITTLAQIQASHDGTSDDQAGDLIFKTNDGSDGASPTEHMRIDSEGKIRLQQSSVVTASTDADDLVIEKTGDTGLSILSTTTGRIYFGDAANDDAGSIRYVHSDNSMRFETDDEERMRIDSDGKVRVGGNSATMSNNLTVEGASYTLFGMKRNTGVTTGTGEFAIHMETNSQTSISYDDEGSVVFGTAGTPSTAAGFSEKMRISSSGEVDIGTHTHSGDNMLQVASPNLSATRGGISVQNKTDNTGGYLLAFYRSNNALIGNISQGSGSVAYNTTSDYRLKENVTDITDGITRVKQLAPKRFNFIAYADTTVDGFLAHEAQTVVPEAINGTKDEVEVWADGDELPDGVSVGDNKLDDDGNTIPVYQGIDQSKLVPLLTAALQEAIAKIETLETKVAALEAE